MIRSFLGLTYATALLALQLCCAVSQTTSSGGTETVNTYALLSNGTPACGAIVRLIDANGWLDSARIGASAVIESTTADINGRIVLQRHDGDSGINIQVDHAYQGLFSSFANTGAPGNDTLRLQPYASYSGTFESSVNALTSVLLSGSAYGASVSNGTFVFSHVAPAAFAVLGIAGMSSPRQITTSGAVTLAPGSVSAAAGLNASPTRLLVDNFESGVGPVSLSKIAPCVYGWYAVSDAGKLDWNKNTDALEWLPFSAQTSGTCHSYISLDPAPGATGGSALEFSAALDSTCSVPYATAGVAFRGCYPNGIDLSSMTSFSVNVRGNGLIWIRFETLLLDSTTNHVSNYSYPVQLTGAWQPLSIPIDSLRILPAGPSTTQYPWTQESKTVIDIEFEFSRFTNPMGDTLHLFVDDFYLNGAGIGVIEP